MNINFILLFVTHLKPPSKYEVMRSAPAFQKKEKNNLKCSRQEFLVFINR